MFNIRNFPVPFDLNSEEKIIGGYLTLKQTLNAVIFGIFIIVTLILPIGGNLTMLIQGEVSGIFIALKVVFVVIFLTLGLLFMYLKPHGMSFFKYLLVKNSYLSRNKYIIYKK